ncbi:MAG: L,D-transpeptidase [Alphaproteobacteria bacterium]|nr:L,D-transpeptidase [Alphaproteobacteria bacterium]
MLFACSLLLALPLSIGKADAAKVVAKVDISDQKMRVYINGVPRHSWKVSTGRSGYRTPVGSYRPTRTHKMWHSRSYNMAPMPYSVFFHRGYAVHGTNHVSRLGRPASHGCVRLHTSNAKRLYKLVKKYGRSNVQIKIQR